MEAILFLQERLGDLIPFVILLGLLIFVHELGHFLVAKFCGVRVEVFSLGFGKKIFCIKRGDTTYAISLIPLGGYVKMFGDDPTATVSEDQQRYSFLHKTVWQRIAIVLAGPLMNLFFAVVLFIAVAYIGSPVAGTKLGEIDASTPAYQQGFRTGDQITEINGTPVKYWHEVERAFQDFVGKDLSVTVKREATNTFEQLTVQPSFVKSQNIFSTRSMVGGIEGLDIYSKAPVLGIVGQETVAAQAGLRPLDMIEAVNGKEINYWRELASTLQAASQSGEKIVLKVSPYQLDPNSSEGKSREVIIEGWTAPSDVDQVLPSLGVELPELYLVGVKSGSPAEKAGLRRGDKIVELNGQPMTEWEKVIELVSGYKKDTGPIEFKIRRLGEILSFQIEPEMTDLMNAKLQEEQRFTVGILSGVAQVAAPPVIEQYTSPIAAFQYGIEKSVHWTKMVIVSFAKLIVGDVSPRNIAGIVTIGRVANQSYEVGLFAFLRVMAIISINLFLINLFPIPILDGGHLLFFSIEAIRGAPLSMRKMEIAQQVGLIIMMTLMAFALFNDIRNWLSAPF